MGLGVLLAASLTGCQNSFDEPGLIDPKAELTPNTTIAEFKEAFADEMAVQTPFKDEASQTPYVIHGRVISSDASGNIYKSLVIQDETGALALSINQSSLYTDYRVGQDVVINATGLWIGQYNNYLQLGGLGEYNGMPQITFMAFDTFKAHTEKNGMPNQNFKYIRLGDTAPADNPYYVITSLEQLNSISASSPEYLYIMSQIVEIPNVSFVDAGKTPPVTFSIYQDNADRYIQDPNNPSITLNVRCSGYSSFYNDPLPNGVGTVRGILSRYGDSWQLLLRGLDDVIFTTKGTKSEPYTVEEALEMQNNGRTGWTEGYIVGSLRSGITGTPTISDVIRTKDGAELDNNVVIAPTADCDDIAQMMAVELPAGSMIRQYANLLDNPGVLGKKLLVEGTFFEYLGMQGITGVGSGLGCFTIEGVEIEGSQYGNGTKDDPYLPTYIDLNPGDMNGVWVKGYIVGFVTGKVYEDGADFSNVFTNADGSSKDFGGDNFILGDKLDTKSVENAIPVVLTGQWRTDYNLKRNADKFHKEVLIQCNIGMTKYGSYGITAISQIEEF